MRFFRKIGLLLLMATIPSALSAFVVNVQTCPISPSITNTVYEYNFDKFSVNPDVTVQVSRLVINADITIALVTDPSLANLDPSLVNLLVIDNVNNADISICQSRYGLSSNPEVTTVKISAHAINPDIRIGLVSSQSNADYVLYQQSELLSNEEAAAFFGVLWMRSQQQNQPTVTVFQLQMRRNGAWVGGPLYRDAWSCSDAKWAPDMIGARCVEVQVPAQ